MTKTVQKSERTESEIAALDIPEAAIEQPEDDSVGRIIAEHIKPTLTGLVITGELSCEEWLKAAEFYQFLRSRTQWIIGDILRYGESRYGEKYAQAVDDHGKSSSRLSTYVYVCNRFEIERRRPELSFDHHAEAASLDPREADRVLLEAIKMRWTKQDVREEVAKINERNGVPKRGRKPGSTAAKVAASGKTPQVPEGEKPLIWDAKPLRVMIMPDQTRVILKGDEPVSADEADWLANKFNHAHGPALAAWLEEHNFIKGGEDPCATQPQSPASQSSAPTLNTSGTLTVASNGAAPNATESAPTPVITWRIQHPGTMLWVDIDSFDDGMKRWFEGFNPPRKLIDGIEEAPDAASNRVKAHYAGTTEAPAAPPASPEPPKAAETSKEHQEQLWELQHACDSMRAERDDAKQDATKLADELSKLRSSMHQYAATPLQRAEESLLAFAAASESVDWEEIGANKLLRQKWLERLLLPCDVVIDRIQAAAIKGKN